MKSRIAVQRGGQFFRGAILASLGGGAIYHLVAWPGLPAICSDSQSAPSARWQAVTQWEAVLDAC